MFPPQPNPLQAFAPIDVSARNRFWLKHDPGRDGVSPFSMCEAHRWFGDDCKRICSKIPAPPTTRSNADSEHVPAQQRRFLYSNLISLSCSSHDGSRRATKVPLQHPFRGDVSPFNPVQSSVLFASATAPSWKADAARPPPRDGLGRIRQRESFAAIRLRSPRSSGLFRVHSCRWRTHQDSP
jgi:hypothetical protein